MNIRDMLDGMITERISEILKREVKIDKNSFKEYEKLRESLESDMKLSFEEFIDNLMDRSGEEQVLLYRTALMDGIHLCLYATAPFIK